MDKYEEALQKARDLYGGVHSTNKAVLEQIFPELAKSEDERMIRRLKEIIVTADLYNTEYQSLLAWLEKQKEQKHTLKFKVGDKVHLEGDEINILTITGIEEDRYLTDCAYGPILFGTEDIWERVEQKPADLSEMMVHKEPYIAPVPTPMVADEQKPVKPSGKLSRQDYIYQLLIDQLITYSDYEYLIGHKPSEWSEEDEDRARSILFSIGYCKEEYPNKKDYTKDVDWFKNRLKSLRPQPKPEWSEEDKESLACAISVFEDFAECKNVSVPPASAKRYLKRLKSLRPQHRDYAITFWTYLDEHRPEGKMCLSNGECADIEKAFIEYDWGKIIRYANKYQPHWKPAKEQMLVLAQAIEAFYSEGNDEDAQTLQSLDNDLKKL